MKIRKRLAITLGIVICSGMCIPGLVWYMNWQQQINNIETQNDTIKSNETIEENPDFSVIESESGNDIPTDTAIEDLYNKINSAGQNVMNVQKTYVEWYDIFNTDYDRFDESADGMRDCQQMMSDMFAGSGTKDQLWYTPNVEGINAIWTFRIGLNYSDTNVPVSWICTDGNSATPNVLSAVTAKYDIEAETFYDEHIYTTYLGESYIVSDEDTEETRELEKEQKESISSNQFISGVKSIANAIDSYIEQSTVEPGEIPYKYADDDDENVEE